MNRATQTPDIRASDGSIAPLITGIIHDAQHLLSQQIELVKVEIKEDLHKTVLGVAFIAAGAGLLMLGGLLLCFMLVYLLNWAFPTLELWLCFLIVGGLLALLGATLVFAAVQRFRSFNPLPDQSLQGLKENLQWKTNLR